MLDIILSFFGDFFLIYSRDWKKTLTDWMFLLLSVACGWGAYRFFRADGLLTTLLAIVCCVGAVCFFIKGGKHAKEAIEERSS